MIQVNNYNISLIHLFTYPKWTPGEQECKILPVLSIEEIDNRWYFIDVLGKRANTTKEQIHNFVFNGLRIKVFGSVYFYPEYYPQYKPPNRKLLELKKKLA